MPVFFIDGLSGAFFQPLAISYGLAVLASMLVALTVTPALALILLRNAPLERRESPLVRWLQRGYQALLARIIRTRRGRRTLRSASSRSPARLVVSAARASRCSPTSRSATS